MVLGVNHSVYLYSSLSDSLPNEFMDMPWVEINYIINHKNGYTKHSIQNAIWNFTDDENISDDLGALALVNAAKADNGSFIPTIGDILAIPILGKNTIQLTFLELVIPPPKTLEGLVWYDSNGNGLQNEDEPGIKAVTVRLYQNDDTIYNSTTTNSFGSYSFRGIEPGGYSYNSSFQQDINLP